MEDALSATRAAVEQGIVPGGGVTLMNAVSALDDLMKTDEIKKAHEDIRTGVMIMRKSLEVPMRKITSNAGEDGSVIIENVRRLQKSRKNHRVGYNVLTEDYVDMVEAGVPDPAKVTRGAVENAASIASMILTTEALISDIPDDDDDGMPAGGGGMQGMGGMGGMM